MNKKRWEKPVATALLRATPGEAVLRDCKTSSGSGAAGIQAGCVQRRIVSKEYVCVAHICSSNANS